MLRDRTVIPDTSVELWNFGLHTPKYQWPKVREHGVYVSNAEIHAAIFGIPAVLNRPRLYKFEDYPFEKREMIIIQTEGRSHGEMPEHVIYHILKKYGPTRQLYQIGVSPKDIGVPQLKTKTLWDLAEVLSQARMFIGIDSGPSWIASCYPDVQVKVLRTRPKPEEFKTWVPLEVSNIHSHWDDRCRQTFNPTEEDIGFTYSYRRL